MGRKKKSFQDQVRTEFPEFADEVNTLSVEQLNTKLATLTKHLQESETAKENDADLANAKAEAKELSAPYRDVKKAVNVKTKYIISVLKERGADA